MMPLYRPGDDVGPLEHWPLDNPVSDYRIVAGNPQTFGRLDAGGPGHVTRRGIWRCTEGTFDCTEQGDEMMTMLAGRCRITDLASGEVVELVTGDTFFTRDGARVRWDVQEQVTKAFFAHKPDGF